jgi:hypothetical protein
MLTKCLFCEQDLDGAEEVSIFQIVCSCSLCGEIHLTKECSEDFEGEGFSQMEKRILSIILRNEYERRNGLPPEKIKTIGNLRHMLKEYMPFDPIAKMDNALINIGKESKYVGSEVDLLVDCDYPYYHCSQHNELISILKLLYKEGFIYSPYFEVV